MMLNVAEQKQSWFIGKKSTHIPTGLIVSILILLELLVVVGGWKYKEDVMSSSTLLFVGYLKYSSIRFSYVY